MLRSIVGNPYVMSLLGAVLVSAGDGTGRIPDVVCCPTCGALLTCVLTLITATARTPNDRPKENAA